MVLIKIEPCQAETMRVIGKTEEYVRKNNLKKDRFGVYMIKMIFLRMILMKLHFMRSN